MKISVEKGITGWWILTVQDGPMTVMEFHPVWRSLLERVAFLFGVDWPPEADPIDLWDQLHLPRSGIYR